MSDWVLPVTVFGGIMFGAFAVLSLMSERRVRFLDRVRRMNTDTPTATRDASLLQKNDRMQDILEMAAPALSKPLMPKSESEQSQLRTRLSAAGWRGETAVSIYLGIKLLTILLGLIVSTVVYASLKGLQTGVWYAAAIGGGVGFFLPDLIVGMRRKERHDAIFYALPDALDLMVICVEAGLALDAAMKRVAQEMRHTAPLLSREVELANLQLQMGRGREEVLHALGERNDVDDLRALAAILIQADKFGSSVGQALRVQSDSMRTRRSQQAEERAQKTAVKLLFPLILFIFPGIFIVLVGPAGIMIAQNMGTAMGGG